MRGRGSLHFAIAVRDTLGEWGADISLLPSLLPDDVSEPGEEWLREWIRLIRALRRMATDQKWDYEIERMRRIVAALELVTEGTDTSQRS